MNFIKTLMESIKDEDTSLMDDALGSGEFSGYLDTGCYMLNAQVSGSLFGGIPNNKVAAFAGDPATGKTFFVLGIVKNFLNNNPNGAVVYYDTEAALTKDMMKSRGIDVKRVIYAEPATIQKFRHHVLRLLEAYTTEPEDKRVPMLIVLDSLGMLSTTKEVEDTAEGKETRDMTSSQLIKGTFRVLRGKLAKAKVPMLVTQHIYSVVGAYVPMKEIAGGQGLKYASDTIAIISKSKDKEGTEVVGNIIKVKMFKSRMSRENTVIELKLSYDTGLDKYYGLLDLAEKSGIFKRVGNKYELPSGEKFFRKKIEDDPETYFTEEILVLLEEHVKKHFKYGSDISNFEESE